LAYVSKVVKFFGSAEWQPYELLLYATDLPKEVKAPRAWLEGAQSFNWRPFDWIMAQYYVSQPTRAGSSSSLPHSPKEPPGQRQSRDRDLDLDLAVAACEAITANIYIRPCIFPSCSAESAQKVRDQMFLFPAGPLDLALYEAVDNP
jgi:hypothetical protein